MSHIRRRDTAPAEHELAQGKRVLGRRFLLWAVATGGYEYQLLKPDNPCMQNPGSAQDESGLLSMPQFPICKAERTNFGTYFRGL